MQDAKQTFRGRNTTVGRNDQDAGRTCVISTSYMHPIGPLSLSHARQFIIADTYSRYMTVFGHKVVRPITFHYSGRTAEGIANGVVDYLSNGRGHPQQNSQIRLLKRVYGVSDRSMEMLTTPIGIMDYFTKQQLSCLGRLGILIDSELVYNTKLNDYEWFVKDVYRKYDTLGLIAANMDGRAIMYNDIKWTSEAAEQMNRTLFVGVIGAAVSASLGLLASLKGGWRFERDDGTGVSINGKIVEPMSDSELVSEFDAMNGGFDLPIDVMFVEEHLKVWIAKKIYAESALLPMEKRTKTYFTTGKITPIEANYGGGFMYKVKLPYLLERHEAIHVRMSMLIAAEPYTDFTWNFGLLNESAKLLARYGRFKEWCLMQPSGSNHEADVIVMDSVERLKRCMEDGRFRSAALEAVQGLPKRLKRVDLSKGRGELIDQFNAAVSYIFVMDAAELEHKVEIPLLRTG